MAMRQLQEDVAIFFLQGIVNSMTGSGHQCSCRAGSVGIALIVLPPGSRRSGDL
jgi:hypothetical protein